MTPSIRVPVKVAVDYNFDRDVGFVIVEGPETEDMDCGRVCGDIMYVSKYRDSIVRTLELLLE